MRIPPILPLLAACCALLALTGAARAPYALERLFAPPWLFGTSLQSVALSDDGRWLACGWDAQAESHRDLWVRDNTTGAWFQLTDYWPEREARRRREFARDLARAREEWDAAHPPSDEAKVALAAGGSAGEAAVDPKGKKQETFDEQKRIDDFEKELRKQRETFGGIGQTMFLRGSHELLWLYDGAVYSADLDQTPPQSRERLRHEQGFWSLSLPPRDTARAGADAVLLVSDADIFLWYPHGSAGRGAGALRQLTTGGYGDRPNDQGYAITPDLQWLAYVSRDYSATRKTQIPDLLSGDPYTTSSSHIRPGDTPESASLTLLDLSVTPPWPIEVKLPEAPHYNVCQVQWSPVPGDTRLLLGVITIDTHELKLYCITPPVADDDKPEIELLYRERDDKWLNWDLMSTGFDAQGGLYLQSERDGRSRLYRLAEKEEEQPAPEPAAAEDEAPAGAAPEPASPPAAPATETAKEDWGSHEAQLLFESAHEITAVLMLSRSPRAILQVAEPDPSCRTLLLLDMATGQAQPLFAPGLAWRAPVALNDAETVLAYSVGDERHMSETALLDLPALGQAPQCAMDQPVRQRLAESAQSASGWQVWADGWDVRFITVPGAAGPIPVKLYLPPGWRASGSYPLLLWAHGAGYAQTAVRQPGFLELFHPWAAEQLNWIVAEVDYRGSSGYGRDWRVDVWGNLGHGEVDDLVSVKHYLMQHYGADARRTALWGWSYGGYLTLMALGLKPGEFPVGCAVAPVTRWENYHSYFATCRLGAPAEHKDEYERSSAETYLKDVTDRLLIIHGLRDDNTVFQSVAQYIEKSHELGVNVELKLFPSDSHGIGNERHYIRVFQEVLDYAQAHWAEDAG